MHHINILVLPSWGRYSTSTISEYFLTVIALTERETSEFVHGDNRSYILNYPAASVGWLQVRFEEVGPSSKRKMSPSINSPKESTLFPGVNV